MRPTIKSFLLAMILAGILLSPASAGGIKQQPHPVQFIPIVNGGSVRYPLDPFRYTSADYPLMDWDYQQWCLAGIECHPIYAQNFSYQAPDGFVVSFVRIFSYDLAIGGASVLYPWDGCFFADAEQEILCVRTIDGSNIANGDARVIRIYSIWSGHWQVVDICHSLIADPDKVYCGKAGTPPPPPPEDPMPTPAPPDETIFMAIPGG